MFEDKVELTDEQVEQGITVYKAIWEVLKQADGLPTKTVIQLLSMIMMEILEESGLVKLVDIVPVPSNTTVQ